jgi:quinol monooxygenase YgiN
VLQVALYTVGAIADHSSFAPAQEERQLGSSIMLRTIARGFVVCIAATYLGSVALPAAAESVYFTLQLKVEPAKSAEFVAFMKEAAVDTRHFKGCEYFAILVDQNDPGNVLFYSIWASKADNDAYRAWRAETKFGEKLAPFLAWQAVPTFYTKVDD